MAIDDSGEPFFRLEQLAKEGFQFVAATELFVSQKLSDKRLFSAQLEIRYSLGGVGKSSVSFVTEVYHKGSTDQPLLRETFKFVFVSRETRKPKPLPQWCLDKYLGKGIQDKPFVVEKFERPPKTFTHRVQVSWLDTDSYAHTNFASYVRFALNALHFALHIMSSASIDDKS